MPRHIGFDVDPELVRLIVILRKFYNVSTNNKIIPYIILLAVTDIASLSESTKWTEQQKAAWQECKKATDELGQAIALCAAKDVLAERKPDDTMSLAELSLLTREKLVAIAKGKHISTTGLRKSGIIRRLKDV